ncbi:MAG: aspartate--tRNA ligase [Gammaproteobacteria bacterium WSBS_2016_MAG_OTU1]
MRTHLCGEVNNALLDQNITVCGWARTRRDHGGVIFIDLRDRGGILQLVADPTHDAAAFAVAESVRAEFVLQCEGVVRARPEGTVNKNLASGAVEVYLTRLTILNTAVPLPFAPDDSGVSEEARLRHRLIDLRGNYMQANMRRRSKMANAARTWLSARDFVEIETPMLAPATPEGARDFLVPSRLQAGAFYALPQSPQLFKQMLMTAGFERYFQIVRCFRDEDLRADRQPEFSQIDVELSFTDEEEVMQNMEEMTRAVFAAADVLLPPSIPRMTYAEAVDRFGCDRPDLRNPLELVDIGDLMKEVEFKVFRAPAQDENGRVAMLCLPGGSALSRKDIDDLTEYAARYGAKGLAYIKVESVADLKLQSPIVKFLPEEILPELLSRANAKDGDIIFFGAGREDIVNASLAAVRDKLGRDRNLLTDEWRPLWITDFPLFEYDYDAKKWHARHHPFTSPRAGDEQHLPHAPQKAHARAYDLTINGVEIGGGSVRIHSPQIQLDMLAALGMDEATATNQFGFLLNALRSGTPPHGGMAFGLDRMAAMAAGASSIRDVIAFPKTQRGQCMFTGAPTAADKTQLRDLHIRLLETNTEKS